jgi:hypothetical protein
MPKGVVAPGKRLTPPPGPLPVPISGSTLAAGLSPAVACARNMPARLESEMKRMACRARKRRLFPEIHELVRELLFDVFKATYSPQ